MSIVTTSPRVRGKPKAGTRKSIVIAAAAVLALVAIAYFVLREGPASSGPHDGGRPSAQPSLRQPEVADEPSAQPSGSDEPSKPPQRINEQTDKRTNEPESSAAVAAEDEAAAKRVAWEIAESNRLAKSEAIMRAMQPKQHFDNEVENVLERVSKQGALFMQVPQIDMPQEQVLEFLRRPVEIYDDDDAEAVAAKERVAEFKTAALKFIEEGGTINQFVRDCAATNKENHDTLEEVKREKRRIFLEQGEEAAQAYLDGVNPQLKEAGLPEVKIGRGDYNALRNKAAAEGGAK